jgi:hypothetical protein
MSVDKVGVAKLEISKDAEQHQVYTFSDLKSDAVLRLTGATSGKQPEYYIVSSSLSAQKSEMAFEMVGFTLNQTTAIMNLIVKKYQFFSATGINKKAITDFLYLEKKDFSNTKLENANTILQMKQKVDSLVPVFNGNQVISKSTNELLAIFENTNDGFLIKDDQNNLIAKAKRNVMEAGPVNITTYILNTFDEKEYELKADEPISAKTTAINCLILYDYLGKGANSYIVKKPQLKALESQNTQMRLAFNKGKSVIGVLTLKDGRTIKGSFDIDFRAVLPDGTDYLLDDTGIMSPYAKNAVYYYLDENNKKKKKTYMDKEIESFQVIDSNQPAYDEFYCKIEYKPEISEGIGATSKLMTLGTLGMGRKSDKIEILAYRVSDLPKTTLYAGAQKLFLLNKKEGQTIVELQPKIFKEQLKQATIDCPTMVEKVDRCEYTRSSISQLIEEYNNCK